MDKLRVEVGVQVILKKKLLKSRLKWAGHVVRMEDEKLAKTEDGGEAEGE